MLLLGNGLLYLKNNNMMKEEFLDKTYEKIRILNETVWEYKADKKKITKWLANFADEDEQLHALYLVSQFMYFGSLQMRELLKGLYRDLYKYRIIEEIRKKNSDTTDLDFINVSFEKLLRKTRFLGVGNPSESGTHLLYFFRQENKLPKSLFINSNEVIDRKPGEPDKLHFPDVEEYIFFDDFCGSGTQAIAYSESILTEIKLINPNVKASYLMLFATKTGKRNVIDNTKFDYVESVFELDESFKCFDGQSRYFHTDNTPTFINKNFAENFCGNIGNSMMEVFFKKEGVSLSKIPVYANDNKLGFGDCQLLIGFYHNTPDNTLPIFWWDEEEPIWYPIFKRYNKIYQ